MSERQTLKKIKYCLVILSAGNMRIWWPSHSDATDARGNTVDEGARWDACVYTMLTCSDCRRRWWQVRDGRGYCQLAIRPLIYTTPAGATLCYLSRPHQHRRCVQKLHGDDTAARLTIDTVGNSLHCFTYWPGNPGRHYYVTHTRGIVQPLRAVSKKES